jgi:hypothetical protein
MSQDVTAKMLKPDFDSEVSGLVHGYLFHEQRPRSLSPLARYAPAIRRSPMTRRLSGYI